MYWSVDELKVSLRNRMRDTEGERQRWTNAEMHDAVNRGISNMYLKVGYYLGGDVPVNDEGQYIPEPYMMDQVLFFVDGVPLGTMTKPGETPPDNSEIKAWVYNPVLPSDTYSVAAMILANATEISIKSLVDTPPPIYGHIQIGHEVMRYHGLTYGSGTFTLLNVERGVNTAQPGGYSADEPVALCVYMDDPRVHNVIMDAGAAYLHSLYPTDGSPTEVQHHQWMMRWHTQQVDTFWRGYLPRKEFVRFPMRRGY